MGGCQSLRIKVFKSEPSSNGGASAAVAADGPVGFSGPSSTDGGGEAAFPPGGSVFEFPIAKFGLDRLDVAQAGSLLDLLRAFFCGMGLTISISFPVEVAARLFLNGVTVLTKGTDVGDKIKKMLQTKISAIEEGMSLLRGKDLETSKFKLRAILNKSSILLKYLEDGAQQEGKTEDLIDRVIQELLADARSCKDSAIEAYYMAGSSPESLALKTQATKVAIIASIATAMPGKFIPEMVHADLVNLIERLLSEKVLRADVKHFLDGTAPLLGSKKDREQRLVDLVKCFLCCETWARAHGLPSLMHAMAEQNRFCLKSLLQAGLFGGARTLKELAALGIFTPAEMVVIAFFMDESAELEALQAHQDFFGAHSISEAAKLYRQGCDKDALGDSAGARDLWGKAAKAAAVPTPATAAGGQQAPAAAADAPAAAKALVRLGWESTGAGRHEEARARFEEAAALAPGLATAHYGLGYVLHDKLGRLEDGIAAYRRALELDPEDAAAHNNLGNALDDQGDLAGAVASYRRALELDPEDADAHYNLGVALKAQGDLAGAVASYRRALELNPEYVDAHNNLGNALKAQGDLAGAVASYRRALELNPEYVDAHNNLGNALKAQGDLAGAVASYRRALELDPEYANAHYNLGAALKAQKDLPGAEAAYRRALEARPDYADALCNLGDLLRERGGAARLRDAEDVLRRAVALDPGCAIKRWKLGLVLEKKGDWAGAEAQFREGMALDPADPDYARKAGEMRRKQGLEG